MSAMYCHELIKMQGLSQSKNNNKYPEGDSLNRPPKTVSSKRQAALVVIMNP